MVPVQHGRGTRDICAQLLVHLQSKQRYLCGQIWFVIAHLPACRVIHTLICPGKGQASGIVGFDNVDMGGFTVRNQVFGVTTQADQQFQRQPNDGIMGEPDSLFCIQR